MNTVALGLILALLSTASPAGYAAEEVEYERYLQRYHDEQDAEVQAFGYEPVQDIQAAGRTVRRVFVRDFWAAHYVIQAELTGDGSVRVEVSTFERRPPTKIMGRANWDALFRLETAGLRPRELMRRDPKDPPPPPPALCHGTSFYLAATGPGGLRQNSWDCHQATDPTRQGVRIYAEALARLALTAHDCAAEGQVESDLERCFPPPTGLLTAPAGP